MCTRNAHLQACSTSNPPTWLCTSLRKAMHTTRRLSTSARAVAQMDHGSGYGIRARGLVPPADCVRSNMAVSQCGGLAGPQSARPKHQGRRSQRNRSKRLQVCRPCSEHLRNSTTRIHAPPMHLPFAVSTGDVSLHRPYLRVEARTVVCRV